MSLSTLVYIDSTGYHYPDYPTVLGYYQDSYRAIYGADVYLEPDSQDGQWIAIQAQAAYDTMALGAAIYNSFSPSTSIGVALSRNVKINGISRRIATESNVDLVLVGQAGSTIDNGQVEDTNGVKWVLPASVVIPDSGTITVNAICSVMGATQAAANTVTKISTPTRGWQTVTNPLAAVVGEPVESDAELRLRQTVSTSLPSLSVFDGTIGAVANVPGVTRFAGYENDSGAVDADGIPAHSIAMVVEGGDVQAIADAIASKKTPGTGTFGTTNATTYDSYGVPNIINFFRPTPATIGVEITLDALQGYTSGYADLIKASVSEYIEALPIGADVLINRLYVPANLPNTQAGSTFDISLIRIKKGAGAFGTSNIVLAFNEAAECSVLNVTVIVI